MADCRHDGWPVADREGLESWEDDHHVYFEAALPDSGRDIDINVHQGLFMMRMEKGPGESGLNGEPLAS